MPSAIPPEDSTSSQVDVLIIGAGPSGLMAATYLSKLGVSTRVVDRRGGPIVNGHADGLHVRTLEIFDSFGFADKVMAISERFMEHCTWAPDERGVIQRVAKMGAFSSHMSRFPPQTLHQGNMEHILLDQIAAHNGPRVERGREPTAIHVDKSLVDDQDAYPVKVEVRSLDPDEVTFQPIKAHRIVNGKEQPVDILQDDYQSNGHDESPKASQNGHARESETIRAKFVLGCDGAHSWTRRQLGLTMEGESTESIWGVMDIVPVTNFPDIRKFTSVSSASGTVIVVPRENRLVRLYIQLGSVRADASASDKSAATAKEDAASIFEQARRAFAPRFSLEYTYCDWWTMFRVGQRVSNSFAQHRRIFLLGDSVHTHTPKAGQGMNVSMQDAFNLAWKLGGVIKGDLKFDVALDSYEAERRAIARQLIDTDRSLSEALERKAAEHEVEELYRAKSYFLSGIVQYTGSLVDESLGSWIKLAQANAGKPGRITPGQRFASHEVVCHAGACTWQTQHWMPSDGRWSLVIFGGKLHRQAQLDRVNELGRQLTSILNRYEGMRRSKGEPLVRTYLLHSSESDDVDASLLDQSLYPYDSELGYDYKRVFADPGTAHDYYGADSSTGGLVVLVRPDQHVGWAGGYADVSQRLGRYLDGILEPAK